MVSLIVRALLFICALWAMPAEATTYYVATTGSNSNNGTDISTPFLTVAYCVSVMVAGDTCLVRGGNYSEGVIRFGVTGTQAAPIKLMNYPGEAPKITFIQPELPTFDRILIQNFSGSTVAIGWITIEGFELTNGHEGIKYYNLHDSVIRRNWIHHNGYQGVLGNDGGLRVRFEQNIFNHNGRFAACAAGTTTLCHHDHGIYAHGQYYTIVRNVFYDNIGYGIQQNGSSTAAYSASTHASTEFAGAADWIVSDNTFAYEYNRAGMVIWGSLCTNSRVENNIFYENAVTSGSEPQGVKCTSCSGSTGISIRNNHFYASGSGGTTAIASGFNADLVTSGNVINVSAPAFVTGGTNSLPASPDFSLTASAPANIARTNEFLNNSTNVVGAFKTIANPTISISANKATLTFPMSTAVPIQVPSSTGVSINCTGAACPGSPTVGSAGPKAGGTDSQVEITINGCTSDNCAAGDQNWTMSYNSASGSWAGYDNIGPYPGLHQTIFSFTNIAVTNIDTGGPPSGVGTPHIDYPMTDGTGTIVSDISGNNLYATLVNGAGWDASGGVAITGGTQQGIIPYGLTGGAKNPSTQSMTWEVVVNVPSGQESARNFVLGTETGTNQRAYIAATDGTWRIGRQSTTATTAGASNLTVSAGSQHLCVTWNSGTDTVTLYKNGAAGTGGATGSYTSFLFPTDLEFPVFGSGFPATATPTTYKLLRIYQSVEDCSALYDAWNAPSVSIGTFGMPSYRFQAVYLPELGGSPTSFGTAINQPKTVVAGGAVAVSLEVYCENVANCERDSFKFEARQNGTGSYIQVPDMETATHIWMWGTDTNTLLNSGTTTSRLSAGSCAVTNGVTMLTSAQVPSIDLPQDGCVVLRYIVRIGETASGYYDLRLSHQGGAAFSGTVNPARLTVVPPQASAGP